MTSQPVSSVTPVDITRASVSGLGSLQERQRQIVAMGGARTNAYQAALAQRQQMDAMAQARQQQEAAVRQQEIYNSQARNQVSQGGQNGGQGVSVSRAPENPRQADRSDRTGGSGFAGNPGARPSGANLGNSRGDQAVRNAEKYLGMWYKWGGKSPSTSFDCSGLTKYVYKNLGINLPQLSAAQAVSGQRTGINNLRPGDLVGWDRVARNGRGFGGADHIALYAGNGWVIEAAKTGTQIRYRKLGSSDRSAWGVRLAF